MATHDKRRFAPLVLIAVLAIAVGGWWAYTTYGPSAPANNGGALSASGSVETEETQVSSVIAGRIVSANATEGARVETGAVMFKLDDAVLKLQVDQAAAGIRAAKAAVKQASDDGDTAAEKAAAKARLDQAEAAHRMAVVQRGYATVTAPSSGVITTVSSRIGETASPGRALASIASVDRLRVSVFVSETDIGKVMLGGGARVTTDSSADTFDGTVSFIAAEAEFTPSNIETKEQRTKLVYEVRIAISDPSGTLKPGMPVDVVFE